MTDLRERVDSWLQHMSGLSAEDSRVISNAFHQTLTAVAGGAFVLSIAFLEKLVPPNAHIRWAGLLVSSWALFAISLVLVLVGFLLNLHWYYKMGKIIGEMASETATAEEYTLENAAAGFQQFKPSHAPQVLSWLSIATFVFGVAALIGFAAINLR